MRLVGRLSDNRLGTFDDGGALGERFFSECSVRFVLGLLEVTESLCNNTDPESERFEVADGMSIGQVDHEHLNGSEQILCGSTVLRAGFEKIDLRFEVVKTRLVERERLGGFGADDLPNGPPVAVLDPDGSIRIDTAERAC